MNWGRTVAKRGVVDGLTYLQVGVQIDQEVGEFDPTCRLVAAFATRLAAA
jgi:hypothetical protein